MGVADVDIPTPTTARSRKKPHRVAVGVPVLAEPLQRLEGSGT
jgi:hypothetical protein